MVAFSHDHGIDIRERPVWEFPLFGSEAERIDSEDPFRASATFSLDGDELTITVDDRFEIVDIE